MTRHSTRLVGLRYYALIGSFVGSIGICMYFVALRPYLHIEEYKKMQEVGRRDIDKDILHPANMKIWSDPFDRDKKNKN